jgi:RimJ/RimL family protein N-acetyltransferase
MADGDVRLRPWLPEDAEVRVRAGRDPEVQRWTSVPRDVDVHQARAWVAWAEDARVRCQALYSAVTLDGRCVGSAGLVRLHHEDLRAEVGYWLVGEARGRGLATRALRLLTGWCFANLNLARLDLFTNTDNDASMAVALRAGYTREALLRSWHGNVVDREDLILFGMLRDEWPGVGVSRG